MMENEMSPGFSGVIRTLRIEKELQEARKEIKSLESAINFLNGLVDAHEKGRAKLLAVVEAAKRVSESEIVKNAPFASYSEALSDLRDALSEL
jgi:tRNA(Ser,Leu) C12 N-acetylase TAN1